MMTERPDGRLVNAAQCQVSSTGKFLLQLLYQHKIVTTAIVAGGVSASSMQPASMVAAKDGGMPIL